MKRFKTTIFKIKAVKYYLEDVTIYTKTYVIFKFSKTTLDELSMV